MTDEKDTTQADDKKKRPRGRTRAANRQAKDKPVDVELHAPRGVNICPECRAEYRHDGDDCGNHE